MSPLLSAGERGRDRSLGSSPMCLSPGTHVRSQKQLAAAATWLSSAEVRPVSWTDCLLQEWRTDPVLHQLEPRPVPTYPKGPPSEEREKDHQSLSVFQSQSPSPFLRTPLVSSEDEE